MIWKNDFHDYGQNYLNMTRHMVVVVDNGHDAMNNDYQMKIHNPDGSDGVGGWDDDTQNGEVGVVVCGYDDLHQNGNVVEDQISCQVWMRKKKQGKVQNYEIFVD